jgi:hypothetical protein
MWCCVTGQVIPHNSKNVAPLRWAIHVVLNQNYYVNGKSTVKTQIYLLAMKGWITWQFLQHPENLHLAHLAQKQHYKLFLLCRRHTIDFRPIPHFTAETEDDNSLNYLDMSVRRTPTGLMTSISRKPTFTDTIIPYTSNHPTQHRYVAIQFLYSRLNSYDLHREEYQHEVNMIHNILHNNSFPIKPQTPSSLTPKPHQTSPTPNHRWTMFTYVGKETTYITNIFRPQNSIPR